MKLLSMVKEIVFTFSVPGAQTKIGRGASMPSAQSVANTKAKDFAIEKFLLFHPSFYCFTFLQSKCFQSFWPITCYSLPLYCYCVFHLIKPVYVD